MSQVSFTLPSLFPVCPSLNNDQKKMTPLSATSMLFQGCSKGTGQHVMDGGIGQLHLSRVAVQETDTSWDQSWTTAGKKKSLLQTQPVALDSVSNDYKITHPETKWTAGIFNNGGLVLEILFRLQFGDSLRYLFRKVQMPTWLKVTKITKLPACGPKRWRAAESLTSFHDNLHGIRGNDLPTSTLPPIMMGQWKMMENAGFLSFIGCNFSTEPWLWEKSGSLF